MVQQEWDPECRSTLEIIIRLNRKWVLQYTIKRCQTTNLDPYNLLTHSFDVVECLLTRNWVNYHKSLSIFNIQIAHRCKLFRACCIQNFQYTRLSINLQISMHFQKSEDMKMDFAFWTGSYTRTRSHCVTLCPKTSRKTEISLQLQTTATADWMTIKISIIAQARRHNNHAIQILSEKRISGGEEGGENSSFFSGMSFNH